MPGPGGIRSRPGAAGRGARLVCALVTLALTVAPAAAQLTETVKRVKPAIVGVGTYLDIRRPPTKLMGTGFVVADGTYVVTNEHVVAQPLADREQLGILVGTGSTAEFRAIQIVAREPGFDVAILRHKGPPLPALRLGDDDAVEEGQEIAFTGYPIGAVLGLFPVTHRGIISARTPVAIPVQRTRDLTPTMVRRLKQPFFVFQLDATAYPGNSGSPLYDQRSGEAVAIISSVFVKETKEQVLANPSGITFAVPIRYARELMREIGALR
ncbi:MAG: serine protease [Alphaproteobacteria bacterium]